MEILNLKTNSLNQNNYNKNNLTPEFIGSLVTYPINYTNEKCLPCDGYKLKIVDYEQLYSVIGTEFNDGTEANDEFRIPDYNITGRFLQPNNNAGIVIGAGLPNITGNFGKTQTISNDSYGNGAFTAVYEGRIGDANNGATNLYHWTFNASRSSSIYGNSTTVQPPSQTVHVCIRYR